MKINKINKFGIGDWGLGIGDWGLGPIPNAQSPIPNPRSPIPKLIANKFLVFCSAIKNMLWHYTYIIIIIKNYTYSLSIMTIIM